MRFNRIILQRLLEAAANFPALVLTGARQVGKTTLLRETFPKHSYVSLDLQSEAAAAENDPDEFLRRYPPPLIIDEVQYAPGIFRHLKRAIDANRRLNGQFILTGSQKFTLMQGVSDSLAGRVAVMELEGLSTNELGTVLSETISTEGAASVLARGSFPEIWDRAVPEREFYQSYLVTYIERDVRQILNVTSLRDFERFMRSAAARSGQLLNKTELGRDVGIKAPTANQWISVLCASNQISLLEPYFTNVTKRMIKSPKLYFSDSGLLAFLLGLSRAAIEGFPGIGQIWETFIYGQFRKYREAYAPEASLWFYRDTVGNEVDLVISVHGKIHLCECKWSELPKESEFGIQKKVAAELGADSLSIIARPRSSFPLKDGMKVYNGFDLTQLFKMMFNAP